MTNKVQFLRKALYFVVFLAVASAFTSCNKGYGCPTNFKVDKVVVKTAQAAAHTILK